MSRLSAAIISFLALLLIASNVWWFYSAVDQGISASYRADSLKDNQIALAQALAIIPLVGRSDITRADIIKAASSSADHSDSFEKDGYLWIGRIGLKFSQEGKLLEVVRAWN